MVIRDNTMPKAMVPYFLIGSHTLEVIQFETDHVGDFLGDLPGVCQVHSLCELFVEFFAGRHVVHECVYGDCCPPRVRMG